MPRPGLNSLCVNQNDYTTDNAGNRLSNTISIQNLNADGTPQFDSYANPVFTSRTETYGYDELSRLTSVNYGDGGTQSYSFDNMGNRLQKVDSGTGTENYGYNAANMLLTRGSNGYTNDADGNTLTGGGRTNVWDSQNRLVSCSFNGNTSSYVYGSDAMRHRSVVNGTTTDYALNGQSVLREGQAAGGTFTPSATYLTWATGTIYRRNDAAGSVRWYVFDGLASVVDEVDPSGNLTDTRGFDVYGAIRSNSGTPSSRHAFCGQLGHTSEDETGLVYMRARYYDPVVGRFASEDPRAEATNWFLYCADDPVGRVDPSGRSWIDAVVEDLIQTFRLAGNSAGQAELEALASKIADMSEAKALETIETEILCATGKRLTLNAAAGAAEVMTADRDSMLNNTLMAAGRAAAGAKTLVNVALSIQTAEELYQVVEAILISSP